MGDKKGKALALELMDDLLNEDGGLLGFASASDGTLIGILVGMFLATAS